MPSGVLFFVHGANATSEGLVQTVARIEDQVRARGWDVTVVAPEWRRRSGLRLGNWKKAIHRRGRPSPMPLPILRGGIRKDAVMKIATNYFEDRREALFDVLGPQMMADVIGYHAHRDSIQKVLRTELTRAAGAAGGRPVLPVALSLGGIALVDLLATGRRRRSRRASPSARRRRCSTRSMRSRRCRTTRPTRPTWRCPGSTSTTAATSCHSSPSRCSGARMGSPASSTCASGRARTSRSRTAPTGISMPVWDAIATAFSWRRVEPLTVREARRLGFEARIAPVRREGSKERPPAM